MSVHPKRISAHERRLATIRSVIELSSARNPSDITTAAIADHMNLTQGALFRHFPSKDAIWGAVMEWVADGLIQRLDTAVEGAATPLAALEAMFLTHIAFVADHPGVPRMMFGELQRADPSPAKRAAQTIIQRYGERLRRLLEAGRTAGDIAADLDIDAAATLFIGTVQGLVMQSLLADDVERIRRDAPRVFAIYLNGIRSTR